MITDKTLLGILGGVAVGAIAGMLFAPDKGSNTRTKIVKKSASATDDLKSKLENITNSLSKKYNSLKNNSEELVENEKNSIKI